MCQSMVDIQPAAAEIRRGKNEDRRWKLQGKNIMPPPLLHRASITNRRRGRFYPLLRHIGGLKQSHLEMWANAERDGCPAKYRWRPLLNTAVWLTPTTREPCSNATRTRNLLKLPGVPKTNETISAASGPKFTILWGHVEEILLLEIFFRLSIHALVAKI